MSILTGIPGTRADAYLIERSSIPQYFKNGVLGAGKSILLSGIRVKEHLLADSGFPPTPRCIAPFDMRGKK